MEDIITSELASENGHVKCPQCEAALSAKPTNMYPVSCTECRGTVTYEQVGVSPWRVFSGYIVHGLVISIFIDLYTQWLTLLQQSLVLLAIALVSYVLWSVCYKQQSDWREAHLATDLAMVAQLQQDFTNRFQQACSRLYKSECNIL